MPAGSLDNRSENNSNDSAAALLRDEEFLLKYPALARALRETVGPLPHATCAQGHLQKLQQPNGKPKPALSPNPTSPNSCEPDGENRNSNVGEPQLTTSKSGTRHEPLADENLHRGTLPLSKNERSSPGRLWSDSNAGINTGLQQIPSKDHANLDEGNALHSGSSGVPLTEGNKPEPPEESLDPPYHYMKRLEEMKRGYVEIMKQRNAVELQYHLLRASGRPLYGASQAFVGPTPANSLNNFMLPSTSPGPHNPYASCVLPGEIRALQQSSCEQATSHDVPCLRAPMPLREKCSFPSSSPSVDIHSQPSHDISASLIDRNELRSVLQMQVAPQTSRRPQVDPAVLFEKTGMDLAVEQLRDNAQRMHMQSRELGRVIKKQHERFEEETFFRKNADPLLNDINSEQQAFIREQLRCIDEAREGISLGEAEARRIEQQSRNVFYHAAYSDNPDPEVVRLCADRLKQVTTLQEVDHLPERKHITKKVAETLEDPLQVMAGTNIDFKEQRLSAAAAQLAVSRMLRNLGYKREGTEGELVRRGDGPAVYKSKFPNMYPVLKYSQSLPVSEKARKERLKEVEEGSGHIPTFADLVTEAYEAKQGEEFLFVKDQECLMEHQQTRREEEDDWARISLSKLHSRNRVEAEAIKAQQHVERTERTLEEMRKRQQSLLEERQRLIEHNKKLVAEAAEAKARADELARERKSPSRSASLTVEAAEGIARQRTVQRAASRTVSAHHGSYLPTHPLSPKSQTTADVVLEDDRGAKTIHDSFDMQPPKRLHTAFPKQSRKKAELLNNALAERLPPYRCEEFVFLSPPVDATKETIDYLYGELKTVFSSGELGSSEHVQLVYDFGVSCCKEFVRKDPMSQEYANALMQALPYYPYQIDIQRAGIIGLLNIFESSKFQENLAPPMFDTLTTLMAIEDEELRADIIAVMAAIIRPKVVVNTELVNILLRQIKESTDPEVVNFCVHVLIVARSPHRKSVQFSLFVDLLRKWRHEPTVLTRACLAIDAAAQRAQLEGLALHERQKNGEKKKSFQAYDELRRSFNFSEAAQVAETSAPKWIPEDFYDIDSIIEVMRLHANNRKLQGAACQAVSSLARVSLPHCLHVAKTALPLLIAAVVTHPESQSVASGFANTVSIIGRVDDCKSELTVEIMEEVKKSLHRHRSAPEVVSSCCSAATALEDFFVTDCKFFDRLTLHIIIDSLRKTPEVFRLAMNANEFIATFAYYTRQLADARRRTVDLGAVEAITKSMSGSGIEPVACTYAFRALGRLVYGQPSDSRVYADLIRSRAMTTFLFVMFKHYSQRFLAVEALRCLGNCIVNEACAGSVLERGVDVICKVVDANCDDIEVVAQGCRCFWLLSSQSGLQQLVMNRGVLLIEHAASQYSSNPDTKSLVAEFLSSILKGKGVSKQCIRPLWDTSNGKPRDIAEESELSAGI